MAMYCIMAAGWIGLQYTRPKQQKIIKILAKINFKYSLCKQEIMVILNLRNLFFTFRCQNISLRELYMCVCVCGQISQPSCYYIVYFSRAGKRWISIQEWICFFRPCFDPWEKCYICVFKLCTLYKLHSEKNQSMHSWFSTLTWVNGSPHYTWQMQGTHAAFALKWQLGRGTKEKGRRRKKKKEN